MKTLSVRNPWAQAIIHLGKSIENRTWRTNYRGPLAIHAGRNDFVAAEIRRHWPGGIIIPPASTLARGAVIGIVDLVDCVPLAEVRDNHWALGPWCWILRNPQPICPVPMVGMLQLFETPLDLSRC